MGDKYAIHQNTSNLNHITVSRVQNQITKASKWGLKPPPLRRKVQTPFLKYNKMERIKWTPFGSAIAVPSGDKTFSRFQKGGLALLKRNVNIPILT